MTIARPQAENRADISSAAVWSWSKALAEPLFFQPSMAPTGKRRLPANMPLKCAPPRYTTTLFRSYTAC